MAWVILLYACVAAAGPCVQWDSSVFTPKPNLFGQISPDYGLYWLRYNAQTGSEEAKRAYTPHDYLPYFSNGKANVNPDPKLDHGMARDHYNATQLKGFYDPSKPTIIFIHGWQLKQTAMKQRLDMCYQYKTGANTQSPIYNTLQYWKGWNVGVVYWNQFADEANFEDVEAKIYSSTAHKAMRWAYLTPGNPTVQYCSAADSHCLMPRDAHGHVKTAADLAVEAIQNAVSSVAPSQEFRIAGQSFGAQMAIATAYRLSQTTNLKPTRLVLMDPYFTVGSLQHLLPKRVVDYADDRVKAIESAGIPVSEYRTSTVSTLPTGDANHWLMDHTAFMRLYPKYLDAGFQGGALLGEQHRSSIFLYFQSHRASSQWSQSPETKWVHSYVNASSSDEQIKAMMGMKRYQKVTDDHKSEYDFSDTQDDVFGLMG